VSIQGALAVGPFQIWGWAFDATRPTDAVTVEIMLGSRRIGAVTADLYRENLEKSGVGNGFHAFTFSCDTRLTAAEIERISARVITADGSCHVLRPLRAVTIDGALDAVEPLQIRGWAFDAARPTEAVMVEILLDNMPVGKMKANLYREDLKERGVGNGFHAFKFNRDTKLTTSETGRISARAIGADGSCHQLPSGSVEQREPLVISPPKMIVKLGAPRFDKTQRPVFILGAARSGTSALVQALLKLEIFEGYQEGHLLDLVAHLSVSLDNFYDSKFDEIDRDTMIARVPIEFFRAKLDELCIDMAKWLFSSPRWIDKTPNSNLVHLAPRFKSIWPNAQFIFMKRRFLENAASRARKFPEYDFHRNCVEWSEVMEAWLQVKDQVADSAVEIDQKYLSEEPEIVAGRLAEFLVLSDLEEKRLAQALRYDLPERTAAFRRSGYDLSEMGWDDAERGDFHKTCGKAMEAFGYSSTSSYYRSGFEGNGFVHPNKSVWSVNLDSEIAHWERVLREREVRRDNSAPTYKVLRPSALALMQIVPTNDEIVRILDVGSGPLSGLGPTQENDVEVTYADALAQQYNELLFKYGFPPTFPRIKAVSGEQLSAFFGRDVFHWVNCANALDHFADPATAFREMLIVCKGGGVVTITSNENEGEREAYNGLHQWNLFANDDGIWLWSRSTSSPINLIKDTAFELKYDWRHVDHGQTGFKIFTAEVWKKF
jgi:SAM-dependent methyltransferase